MPYYLKWWFWYCGKTTCSTRTVKWFNAKIPWVPPLNFLLWIIDDWWPIVWMFFILNFYFPRRRQVCSFLSRQGSRVDRWATNTEILSTVCSFFLYPTKCYIVATPLRLSCPFRAYTYYIYEDDYDDEAHLYLYLRATYYRTTNNPSNPNLKKEQWD